MILLGIIDIDNCMAQMTSSEKINIKKIETKILNGRKINVKVVLEIEVRVYSNENINFITNINNLDDIQILNNQKVVNSVLGSGNTRVHVKDTISINPDDDLAEIMRVQLQIINKDIKLSYNKVLVKADAKIEIMYLTEDNRIKTASAQIPIMGFIDIENIGDDNVCDTNFIIKNLIIKPNNSETSSIYVEAEIEIGCVAYEQKAISLMEDLYSISSDLDYKQKEVLAMASKKNIKDMCKINDTVQIPEIINNKLYNVQINPVILNETVRNGKIIFEGELNLEFIYEITGGIESRNFQVPFNFEMISDDIDASSNASYNIEVKDSNFIVNDGNIDLNLELEFNVNISKNEKIKIIDEISAEQCDNKNIYSMVIYFVKPGDTMWKIAKKFKSTVEDISKVNNIEDPSKIYPGEQLYIPKFVNKQIAV